MIASEYLAMLRRRMRSEMVLVMVQLEQVCPGWWEDISDLAEDLGTDRTTLNRSLRKLEDLDLIRRTTITNQSGTWVWWVKRHANDEPRASDEPAWVLSRLKSRERERIPISKRREWARARGIPMPTLCSFLYGHQQTLRGQWRLVGTPLDQFIPKEVAA